MKPAATYLASVLLLTGTTLVEAAANPSIAAPPINYGGGSLRAGSVAMPGVGSGVIEEDPEVAKERLRMRAEEDYIEGMKARAAGNTEMAVRLLLRAAGVWVDTPYKQKAFEELTGINELASKELEVARQLLAGDDPGAGLLELKRITRVYSGLQPARDAGALRLQLEADLNFQARLKAGRLAAEWEKAKALEARAEELLKPAAPAQPAKTPGDPAAAKATAGPAATKPAAEADRRAARFECLLQAYEAYLRIAQQGGDTEPGRRAAEARDRLQKDADLMAYQRQMQAERKVREWMGLAEAYFRAGRLDSARQYCEKILAEYPESPQAAQAKELLAALK